MAGVDKDVCEEVQKRIVDKLEVIDHRMDKHDEKIDKLSELSIQMVELMKQSTKNYEQLTEVVESQNERIRTLEEKPAKRWNTVVNAILQWAAVALIELQMFGKHS